MGVSLSVSSLGASEVRLGARDQGELRSTYRLNTPMPRSCIMRAPSVSPRSLPTCEGELELPLAVSVDTLSRSTLYFSAALSPPQTAYSNAF